MISDAERQYVVHSVERGLRLDGRSCLDYRPVELELGLVAQANGSARLHLGATDVLVGVKVCVCMSACVCCAGCWRPGLMGRPCLPQAEVGVPDMDRPSCGRLQVTVECSPCASPEFEVRCVGCIVQPPPSGTHSPRRHAAGERGG